MEHMEIEENPNNNNIPDEEFENRRRLSQNVTASYNSVRDMLNQFSDYSNNYNQTISQELTVDQIFDLHIQTDYLRSQAAEIVKYLETSVEFSLKNIQTYCMDLYQKLWNDLISFQTQHQEPHNLHQLIEKVSHLVNFLSQISIIVNFYLVENAEFQNNLAILSPYVSYQNNFRDYLQTFRDLETSIRKKFCLVVISNSFITAPTGSAQDITVAFVPTLATPASGEFHIKAYLVQEDTVAEIQRTNSVPHEITSVVMDTMQQNNENQETISHPTLGKIFLDGSGQCEGKHNHSIGSPVSKKRARTSLPLQKKSGHLVQTITGMYEENRSCYCFQRRLVIAKKPGIKEFPATAKYCNLFVLDVVINNQVHQVWTFNFPFCIRSHTGQNEKVSLPSLWYEVVAKHPAGLLGLKVDKKAPWEIVKQLFNKFCFVTTGRGLLDIHLDFLKEKAEQLIFENRSTITDATEIYEDRLFNSKLWVYFYNCISAVRIGSPFNEIWMANDFAAFVSQEKVSRDLTAAWENTPEAQRMEKIGLFAIRFSDCCPGGFVFVYIAKRNKTFAIEKLEPLDVLEIQTKKRPKYTAAVLKHLNATDKISGLKAIKALYPINKTKNLVFRSFYDFASKNPQCDADFYERQGYVPST